ncbi:MAG TPA: branched-chain amino acid transaminase [Sulfolobales archaeon]|nr:branched-chain amino acid transaminase [Sulfolobales archaeon]
MSEWSPIIWFDGKFVPFEEAKIHVMTYSLHYGVGVFEGIRAYRTYDGRTAIFKLREHVRRFFDSTKIYKLEIPFSEEELINAIRELVRKSGFSECYIRPIAFINITKLGVKPTTRRASVAIGLIKWDKYLGKAYYEGARVTVSPWRRIPPNSLPLNAKAIGQYLNSYLAALDADVKGYDEALLLDTRGFVSEGPGENIFMVKNGTVYTPPLYASVLPGVTRETVIKILEEELEIKTVERDIALGELLAADEAFFTGTAAEITPIVEIDGVKIGNGKPGPLTRKIQTLYDDIVRGKIERYREWLFYV